MKQRTYNNIAFLLALILTIVTVMLTVDANATTPKAEAKAESKSISEAEATGGDATAINEGGNHNSTLSVDAQAVGASSGDSTSTCQKVRDIRFADGLLFGLRWDMTDKDCRRLKLADEHYDHGNTYFADTLTCTVPFVMEAFENVDECKTALEKNDIVAALKSRIDTLEKQKQALAEERAAEQRLCNESKNRIAERCRESK